MKDNDLIKDFRIANIKMCVEMLELEERIVKAIIDGGSPVLIEQGKALLKAGHDMINKKRNFNGL